MRVVCHIQGDSSVGWDLLQSSLEIVKGLGLRQPEQSSNHSNRGELGAEECP